MLFKKIRCFYVSPLYLGILFLTVHGPCIHAADFNRFFSGEAVGVVTLLAVPDPDTAVYALEESLPQDTYATVISHGGVYDNFQHKIKWGPFFDDQSRTLSYTLVSSGEQAVSFTGSASWDGSEPQEAAGVLDGATPNDGFYSWILKELGSEVLFWINSYSRIDIDRDTVGLLGEYVFGFNPNGLEKPAFELAYDYEQSTLKLQIEKRIELGEITLRFWESQNLQDWSEFSPGEPTNTEVVSDDMHTVTYDLLLSSRSEFIQLRLYLPTEN